MSEEEDSNYSEFVKLGRDSSQKREEDLMSFLGSQHHNEDDHDDDWEDAMALRTFLKLPKHAKEKLTNSADDHRTSSVLSKETDYGSAGSSSHERGRKPETVVGMISSQFGLGDDVSLDGKAWHGDDDAHEHSAATVESRMNQAAQAGVSSGSLAIDLFANSELTMEHIAEAEETPKPIEDQYGFPLDLGLQQEEKEKEKEEHSNNQGDGDGDGDGDGESMSGTEFGAFGGSSSMYMRGATKKGASATFQADFIAQRALLKKVAKEHVSITDKLAKAEQGFSEAAKHRIIEGFTRTYSVILCSTGLPPFLVCCDLSLSLSLSI
jgi:hypothetical protein